ncbi:hypothetical protein IH980_02595 [Patescibacteria group bacterium]|nr:hypothetical protein [Patescibacteria group bacterium]
MAAQERRKTKASAAAKKVEEPIDAASADAKAMADRQGKRADSSERTAPAVPEREVGEEEVLLTWKAPVRPFKKRDRDYYTTIAAIAFLVIIILGFLREFLLIAVVIAFAFVSYVFAAIPPEKTEHKLTNRGIRSADKLYRWIDLRRYWYSEKYGQRMVVVQTVMLFPGQLLLMLGNADEGKIKKIFNERLPHEEPEPTFLDKSARWLSEKVPLEKEPASPSSTAGKSSA